MKSIEFKEIENNRNKYISVEMPNKCPICNAYISPKILGKSEIDTSQIEVYYSLILLCSACKKHFFLSFKEFTTLHGFTQIEEFPYKPFGKDKIEKNAEIFNISPTFYEILEQASISESLNLHHISGVAYRKALEFLVKDYLKYSNPDDKDAIEVEFLSASINRFENNNDLKTLLKAATWIGNDETHYIRKHENYDISHLKDFINVALNTISNELIIKNAKNLLNN